ncbi:synaptotagmin-6 isoform X2 [Octopus sinensis]|uniref:Synaptotagmin-6 isoform X2 n=1 Tax=Octopus sinensis TaxID=2607531 RepID=A0A7E6FV00_9MOLL|nr:synaptotagmin-6 isoform X2 [Octopus sinensis]
MNYGLALQVNMRLGSTQGQLVNHSSPHIVFSIYVDVNMVPLQIFGVVFGVIGAFLVVAIFLLCRAVRRKKGELLSPSYRAIGDYNPAMTSLSISSGSNQELQMTKEAKTVQPHSSSTSTVSRGSTRSDQHPEETSSISARSDTSVDSSVFDASFGSIRPDLYPRKETILQQCSQQKCYGRLHLRLKYDFRTSDLVVHLIEVHDLMCPDSTSGFSDPYIKLFLYPEVDERRRQSSVQRRTLNPFFNEFFKFPIPYEDLQDKSLIFQVFNYDKFSRHSILGEVNVDLNTVETSSSVEIWSDIQRYQRHACTMGELLISLSYLPTAERLTVVIIKAKDLRILGPAEESDPFVRISLIVDGKKIKRKKSSVQRSTLSPVWNEALTFNVPAEILPKVALECCVWDHDIIGHGELIGKCTLGPERQGSERKHWMELLSCHRTSTAMWHSLHK